MKWQAVSVCIIIFSILLLFFNSFSATQWPWLANQFFLIRNDCIWKWWKDETILSPAITSVDDDVFFIKNVVPIITVHSSSLSCSCSCLGKFMRMSGWSKNGGQITSCHVKVCIGIAFSIWPREGEASSFSFKCQIYDVAFSLICLVLYCILLVCCCWLPC